ncbi:methyltransferase family protein [Shimia sp. MIT1388]|uniref:methyltransferase family protein n=1 Tax=Shimia sp. MIT1388 TaxID=3096992 RepID=UPI00399A3E26
MDLPAALSDALRLYLAGFFTFVAVFYTTRIAFLKAREGAEFVLPGMRFCASWWNHMVFRFFRVTIWGVCLARAIDPGFDAYLGLWAAWQRPAVVLTGAGLLTFGFALALVSHFALGRHWRSGFDGGVPETLLEAGPYRFSRHPAFLGVMLAQVGFWLALPSCFSTVCLIVGLIAVYHQMLLEERHMAARFGARYMDYSQRVRRWV